MLKMLKYIFWLILVLLVFAGLDQTMIRVPLNTPGLKEGQRFYVDFRSRLLDIFTPGNSRPKDAIESVIEKNVETRIKPPVESKRYLYVDGNGSLQFADSLMEVPAKYRQSAQPLAD